MHERVVDVADI